MAQIYDGRWVEKHGGFQSVEHNAGQNPDNLSWRYYDLIKYDSKTVYMAITD